MLVPSLPIRIPRRLALAFLLAALWPVAAVPAQDSEPVKYRNTFQHDFRGKPLPAELALFGHEIESYAKPEAQGLRITLPKNREKFLPVGVKTTFAVRGDFEITVTVEILQAETPETTSFGVGATIYVNKTAAPAEGATLGRLLRPGNREVIGWDRSPGTKSKFEGAETPCTDKIVRLRLKRTASRWFYQWAPGSDGENFHDIHDCDFGTEELGQVVLRCSSGGQARAADVRFLALRIRSDGVSQDVNAPTKTSADKAAPPDAEPTKTASRGWLMAALLIGAAIVLGFAVVIGATLFLLRRRRAQPEMGKQTAKKKG